MADKNLVVKRGLTAGNLLIDSLTDSINTSSSGALATKINLNIITSEHGSMVIPFGNNSQRDIINIPGYTRYNTDSQQLEVYNELDWVHVGTGNAFITSTSGSFITPSGTNTDRDNSPSYGYLRYNSTIDMLEVYTVAHGWYPIGVITVGNITSPTGSFITPAGTIAERDITPLTGYFRYNTQTGNFEGFTGILPSNPTGWSDITAGVLVLNQIDGGTYGSSELPPSVSIDGGNF